MRLYKAVFLTISTRKFPCRSVLQRRLRILTLPMRVGDTKDEVLQNADAEAILVNLMHKIGGRRSKADGTEEGRSA